MKKYGIVPFDVYEGKNITVNQKSVAIIKLKENAVLCGLELAVTTFKTIDNKIKIVSKKTDGIKFKKGTVVLKIKGSTRKQKKMGSCLAQ